MRRNFPRTYTTTYLRVVVVGQLVALADSEITSCSQAVLTDWIPPFPLLFELGLFRYRFGLGLRHLPCSINS